MGGGGEPSPGTDAVGVKASRIPGQMWEGAGRGTWIHKARSRRSAVLPRHQRGTARHCAVEPWHWAGSQLLKSDYVTDWNENRANEIKELTAQGILPAQRDMEEAQKRGTRFREGHGGPRAAACGIARALPPLARIDTRKAGEADGAGRPE